MWDVTRMLLRANGFRREGLWQDGIHRVSLCSGGRQEHASAVAGHGRSPNPGLVIQRKKEFAQCPDADAAPERPEQHSTGLLSRRCDPRFSSDFRKRSAHSGARFITLLAKVIVSDPRLVLWNPPMNRMWDDRSHRNSGRPCSWIPPGVTTLNCPVLKRTEADCSSRSTHHVTQWALGSNPPRKMPCL